MLAFLCKSPPSHRHPYHLVCILGILPLLPPSSLKGQFLPVCTAHPCTPGHNVVFSLSVPSALVRGLIPKPHPSFMEACPWDEHTQDRRAGSTTDGQAES